jgi:hypothetical protein
MNALVMLGPAVYNSVSVHRNPKDERLPWLYLPSPSVKVNAGLGYDPYDDTKDLKTDQFGIHEPQEAYKAWKRNAVS